jgi:hypothetical protein
MHRRALDFVDVRSAQATHTSSCSAWRPKRSRGASTAMRTHCVCTAPVTHSGTTAPGLANRRSRVGFAAGPALIWARASWLCPDNPSLCEERADNSCAPRPGELALIKAPRTTAVTDARWWMVQRAPEVRDIGSSLPLVARGADSTAPLVRIKTRRFGLGHESVDRRDKARWSFDLRKMSRFLEDL